MFGGLCRLHLAPKKIIHWRISRCMSSSVEGKNANPKNNLASHNIVLYSQVYKFTDCIRSMYCICCWEWNTLRFFPTWFTIAFYHFIPFIFPTISSHLISFLPYNFLFTWLFSFTSALLLLDAFFHHSALLFSLSRHHSFPHLSCQSVSQCCWVFLSSTFSLLASSLLNYSSIFLLFPTFCFTNKVLYVHHQQTAVHELVYLSVESAHIDTAILYL